MKKIIKRTAAMVIAIIVLSSLSFITSKWNIDPNYSIKFSGARAEGTFSGLKGKIVFDPAHLSQASIEVEVDVHTIKTGNQTKDKHAKGENWFDAESYPKIKFSSSSFKKSGNGYSVEGKLTLHGITRSVLIPFQYTAQGNQGMISGTFNIDRQDYGIEGNFLGFAVGDEFEVDIQVPISR